MTDNTPKDPGQPYRAPSPRSCNPRESIYSPRNQRRSEDVPESEGDAGKDEILRTNRDGRGIHQVTENVPSTVERAPDADVDRVRHAPAATGKTYGGWLPTERFLTLKEVWIAAFVAEFFWIVAAVVLTGAGRLVDLPKPVAGNEVTLALLLGAFCGLYALLRLRSRRLAWRSHLRGER